MPSGFPREKRGIHFRLVEVEREPKGTRGRHWATGVLDLPSHLTTNLGVPSNSILSRDPILFRKPSNTQGNRSGFCKERRLKRMGNQPLAKTSKPFWEGPLKKQTSPPSGNLLELMLSGWGSFCWTGWPVCLRVASAH